MGIDDRARAETIHGIVEELLDHADFIGTDTVDKLQRIERDLLAEADATEDVGLAFHLSMATTPLLAPEEFSALAKAIKALLPSVHMKIALGITEHWIVFRFVDPSGVHRTREYGMWRVGLAVFEADRDGAMGDEPVLLTYPDAGR